MAEAGAAETLITGETAGKSASKTSANVGLGGAGIGKKAGQQQGSPKGMEKKFAMGLLPMILSFSSCCAFTLITMVIIMYTMHMYT